jgi:hypothetical protein
MGSREHYNVRVTCPSCGRSGTASWSEWDRPTPYSGTGRRLESVPPGFIVGSEKDKDGDPSLVCEACGVAA